MITVMHCWVAVGRGLCDARATHLVFGLCDDGHQGALPVCASHRQEIHDGRTVLPCRMPDCRINVTVKEVVPLEEARHDP